MVILTNNTIWHYCPRYCSNISVLRRCQDFLLAAHVDSHTLTLTAAVRTAGQPGIEVFMWENLPWPRLQNWLFCMQTDTQYSNWGISLWSVASNPCCSWSRLCRNVLFIASKWLEVFCFFFTVRGKHLRIVFFVTNRRNLHFLIHSLVPTCKILCYLLVGAPTTVVTLSLSLLLGLL